MHGGGQTRALLRVAFRSGRLAERSDIHQSHANGQGAQRTVRCGRDCARQTHQTVDIPGGHATQHRRTASVQKGRLPYGHCGTVAHPAGRVQHVPDVLG